MPVIYLARIHICTVSLRSIKNIYIARIHVPVIYCTYTYALPIVYIRTYTCCSISARIHVHVMCCVYICVCMCWNTVNMPGCGRDGGFVTMVKLRLDHHLSRRPCTFLHEMGGFTHEWSLQLLPFDEGIYLMWNPLSKDSICGGYNYRDWCLPVINLRQYLPIANICHKALKLYHSPKSQI